MSSFPQPLAEMWRCISNPPYPLSTEDTRPEIKEIGTGNGVLGGLILVASPCGYIKVIPMKDGTANLRNEYVSSTGMAPKKLAL
jgi:hypothetical protein